MSELKAYLCIQARDIENKTFSCYNQTLAVKNAPEATMVEVYLKSEADKVIADKDVEIESLKASHYAEMVDAGMRNRRLKRALWLARAELCHRLDVDGYLRKHTNSLYHKNYFTWNEACVAMEEVMCEIESKCRAKAEEYK